MRTPDQYREFAAECYRLAAEAKTETHRKGMEEMARAWNEVADEVERQLSKDGAKECVFLRCKWLQQRYRSTPDLITKRY
jgi:hypothetical protein